MAYANLKKGGETVVPCRVVGIVLEELCEAETNADLSTLTEDSVTHVDLWRTQKLQGDGSWSSPGVCKVRAADVHRCLALYLLHRLYKWVSGLGLAVVAAKKPRTRGEGSGHHDLVLKHAGHLCKGPFLCEGFISTELKLRQVSTSGRGFKAAWEQKKKDVEEALSKVLLVPQPRFGAVLLLMIGICDAEPLEATEPPLMVKAQLLVRDESGGVRWSSVLLDQGTIPVAIAPPPPKRQRAGRSWDEVRAKQDGRWADLYEDGVEYVRLLDLFGGQNPGPQHLVD